MSWNGIRGHDRQRELFCEAVRRHRLAHAYLFIGPEGIGKRLFALELAKCLFCRRGGAERLEACGECPACVQMRARTHPDLIQLARPEGKRELPVELMIGARDRRGREGLCHELAMRPMSADRRIAIVDDAQTMNAESTNALLKTLEEPPPGSLLILLTPAVDAMLPTIQSRCQPITFAPLPDEDVARLLLDLGWVSDERSATETAELAGGSMHTARQLLQPELRSLRDTLFNTLGASNFNPFTVSESVLAIIDGSGGDTAAQRMQAEWAVRFCIDFFRLQLREHSAPTRVNGQDADPETMDVFSAQLERCVEAELHLQRSMPIPLCLEGLFDALARIRRGGDRCMTHVVA